MLHSVGLTDAGTKRDLNEDFILADDYAGLYVVADGMGGYMGGVLPARLACETVANFIRASRQGSVGPLPYEADPHLPAETNRLAMAVRIANDVIVQQVQHHGTPGIATTILALLFHESFAHIVHVGDTRLYRARLNRLEALTIDHTEFNDLVAQGLLSPQAAAQHPDKHSVSRVLGISQQLYPTVRVERLKEEDVFLLCTDGLHREVSERKIAEVVAASTDKRGGIDIEKLPVALVHQANDKDGKDNVSVVAIRHRWS